MYSCVFSHSSLIPSQRLLDFHLILLESVLFGKEVMKRVWFSFSSVILHSPLESVCIVIPSSSSLIPSLYIFCDSPDVYGKRQTRDEEGMDENESEKKADCFNEILV